MNLSIFNIVIITCAFQVMLSSIAFYAGYKFGYRLRICTSIEESLKKFLDKHLGK
jgi:hypothetical protein